MAFNIAQNESKIGAPMEADKEILLTIDAVFDDVCRNKKKKTESVKLVDILSPTKPIVFKPACNGNHLRTKVSTDNGIRKNLEERILINQINSSKITQLKLLEEKVGTENDCHEGILMELCPCDNCLKYRESVMHYYVEECEYNILWLRLQCIVKKYYDLVSDDADDPVENRYRELMCSTKTKWLSDGQMDYKKNIQISLASNLPLNNDMTVILIFKLLYSRDPHQLFELLCLQVTAMLKAYIHKFLFREPLFVLTKFLQDLYKRIKKGAQKLELLMIDHLKQFKLSWMAVNQQLFLHWVYTDILMIIQQNPHKHLKSEILGELLQGQWPRSWKLLEKYQCSNIEQERQRRIELGQKLLESIKGCDNQLQHLNKTTVDFWKLEESDWQGILLHIRALWQPCNRYSTNSRSTRCRVCKSHLGASHHAWDCDCRTCSIAGGFFPYLSLWESEPNAKCSVCNLVRVGAEKNNRQPDKDLTYHLSWAVFKHLPGRLEYIIKDLQLAHMCNYPSPKRCRRIECHVALGIILGHYPKSLAEHLVSHYKPLSDLLRALVGSLSSPTNILLRLHSEQMLNVDILMSALAEIYRVDLEINEKQLTKRFAGFLKPTGKDIDLNMAAYANVDRSHFMSSTLSFPDQFLEHIYKKIDPIYKKPTNQKPISLAAIFEQAIAAFQHFLLNHQFFLEDGNNQDCDGNHRLPHHHDHDEDNSIHDHAECTHTTHQRGNATRNRLRKRLSQMTQPDIEKNELSLVKEMIKNRFPQLFPDQPVKSEEIFWQNLRDQVNMGMEDEAIETHKKEAVKWLMEKICPSPINDFEGGMDQSIGDQSLDSIVDYIEGKRPKSQRQGSRVSTMAEENVCQDGKKAAKKAKQKQKRREQKMLEELEELKKLYHEQWTEEQRLRSEFKTLRATKRKTDKKRLPELELELKKAARVSSKTDASICSIICEIREFHPDFKYNYQPPPVPKQKPKVEEKVTESEKQVVHDSRVIPPTIPIPNGPMFNEGGSCNAFSQFVAMQRGQSMATFKPNILSQSSSAAFVTGLPTSSGAVKDDPSTRMVTIRRVNMPSSEPQVTVTAKGPTPEYDRLLYSFINGQMVPASDLTTVLEPDEPNIKVKNSIEKKVTLSATVLSKDGKSSKGTKAKKVEKQECNENKKKKEKKQKKKDETVNTKVSEDFNVTTKSKAKEVIKPEPVKKKPKPKIKYEYLDPSFSKNKFGLLSNEEDADESYEEDIPIQIEDPVPVKSYKLITNPQLVKESSLTKSKNNKMKPHVTPLTPMVEKEAEIMEPTNPELKTTDLASMSNRERRKWMRLQKRLDKQPRPVLVENDNIEKAVQRAERVAESLTHDMNKLNLNADTTIELVNQQRFQKLSISDNDSLSRDNISIMDQLSRGIRVEGLQLPPGITLTRLDSARAEQIQRKKDAIERISRPIGHHINEPTMKPQVVVANPTLEAKYSNGSIMPGQFVIVENPDFKTIQPVNEEKLGTKKGKKKKKKANVEKSQKMVTLRNPLFSANEPAVVSAPPVHKNPIRVKTSGGVIMDTPAAIIQNENGMYTIRNPALHQAFTNAGFSGMSSHMPNNNNLTEPSIPSQETSARCTGVNMGDNKVTPSNKAIGSEKRQKQEPWQPQLHNYTLRSEEAGQYSQQRSYSPFNSQLHFSPPYNNGNCNGTAERPRNNDGFSAYVASDVCGGSNGHHHQCEDPHPSELVNNQKYFREPPLMSFLGEQTQRYEDISFLQNLQPGQRLNSEVTIHNINESKYLLSQQQQQQEMPLSNHVEITRIPMTGNGERHYHSDNERTVSVRKLDSNGGNQTQAPVCEKVFEPNDDVNLSELTSDERDIESFKRFNYFFEPPKNKPKVNLNLQDIYNNSKRADSPSNVPMGTMTPFNGEKDAQFAHSGAPPRQYPLEWDP